MKYLGTCWLKAEGSGQAIGAAIYHAPAAQTSWVMLSCACPSWPAAANAGSPA